MTAIRPINNHRHQLKTQGLALRTAMPLSEKGVSVVTTRYDRPNFGLTEPNQPMDYYSAVMHRRGMNQPHRMWIDGGKSYEYPAFRAGSFGFRDYRERRIIELNEPFETVIFLIPRRAIRDLTDELELPEIREMAWRPGQHFHDPKMECLVNALIPSIESPEPVDQMFSEQILSAMMVQMVAAYGNARPRTAPKGGLPPWLEKRAKDFLVSRLDSGVTLSEVAAECGLSPTHFARSFRLTTGLPPYLWLQRRRIAEAKALLHHSTMSISDVGRSTGFANQSHFTHAFKTSTGITPLQWRQIRSG